MAKRKINVVLSLSADRGMLFKTARRKKSRRKIRRRHRRYKSKK